MKNQSYGDGAMTREQIARELVRVAKGLVSRTGERFESDSIRAHQFMNSIKIWDLSNAGKRGRKVDVLTIIATDNASEKMLDGHFKAVKIYDSYSDILSLFRDLKYDFPDDFEIHETTERGVDVTPAGFQPIKIDGRHVFINSDYKSFVVKDTDDEYNEETCIPAFSGGKNDVKVFYRFVKDHASWLKNATFSDVLRAMKKQGIKYHRYCAMD
jgi:hypothetical protein